MKKISQLASLTALTASFLLPLSALAQAPDVSRIKLYSDAIVNIINNLAVPVLMAIAFIVFLWGVYKYFILGAADEKSRIDGRQFALWGIVGFVVILSVWGLVAIVMSTLGFTAGGRSPTPPTFGGSGPTQSSNCAVPGADNFGSPGPCTYNNQPPI